MSSVLIISGSPSSTSRTERLARSIAQRVAARDVQASLLDVRDLPAADLLHARFDAPSIVEATARVAAADGIIVATPVYKAAYSGLLKTFLDVLPQFGLRGKVVLPLATGGSVAHVLAIDYALRPVLSSLDPLHVVNGLFLLDKQITVLETGEVQLEPEVDQKLNVVIDQFLRGLQRVASAGIRALFAGRGARVTTQRAGGVFGGRARSVCEPFLCGIFQGARGGIEALGLRLPKFGVVLRWCET